VNIGSGAVGRRGGKKERDVGRAWLSSRVHRGSVVKSYEVLLRGISILPIPIAH